MKRVFQIEVSRLFRVRNLLLFTIGSLILSFLLVFMTAKGEQEQIYLYPNKDNIEDRYEQLQQLVQVSPSVENKRLLQESQIEMELLQIAQKYDLRYQNDMRVPYLSELESIFKEEMDDPEDASHETKKVELLSILSLSFSDFMRMEKEKEEERLETLEAKENLSKDEAMERSILTENVRLRNFYLSHPEITWNDPLLEIGDRLFTLFSSLYEPMISEDDFWQNNSLLTTYGTYDRYVSSYQERVEQAKAEYTFLWQCLEGGYPLTNQELHGGNHPLNLRNLLQTLYVYGSMLIVVFLLITLFGIYQDDEYQTILQYQVHVSKKGYFLGKYFAYTCFLFFLFLLGFALIPLFSSIFMGGSFPNISYFAIDGVVSTTSYLCRYLTPYFLQFCLGMLFCSLLQFFSCWHLPRGVLFCVLVILVGSSILFPYLGYSYDLSSLFFIPFTFFYYPVFLDYQLIFSNVHLWGMILFALILFGGCVFGQILIAQKCVK